MNKNRILCAAVLAGASLAAAAQSDAAPDTRWHAGLQLGSVHDNGRGEPSAQITFGYDIDRTWSVEALLNANMLFVRAGTDPTQPYEFDSAWGAGAWSAGSERRRCTRSAASRSMATAASAAASW